MNLSWLAYLLAAAGILLVVWFTFSRVPRDANRHTRRPDQPS
jgi:hypothetical protein